MKKILFCFLLSSVGLWAQPEPGVGIATNRDDLVRQAMQRAMANQSNNAAVRSLNNPAAVRRGPAASPGPSAILPPPAVLQSAPIPGTPGAPNPAAPATGLPVPGGPPAPGAVPPGAAPPGAVPPGAFPQGVPPAAPGAEPMTAIKPPPAAANAPVEEVVEPGVINFKAVDLTQFLEVYAELVNRTILRPASLPAATISLKTQTRLTKKEAKEAFDAVLGMNGIAVVDFGDKFVKVVPTAQAGMVGAKFTGDTPDKFAEMGQFVTYVVQLTNARPTELTAALQPFQSPGNNGVLAIDSSQMLVLRDFTENVKRMLEMIKKIDVAVPSEFISEVIPIKYAIASDIASALNSLSSGGGGATVGSSSGGGATGSTRMSSGSRSGGFNRSGMGGMGGYGGGMGGFGNQQFGTQAGVTPAASQPGANSFTSRLQSIINRAASPGDIQVIGVTKIIADERTNSLLVFATREDLKTIKEIVAKLDVVLAQVLIEAVIVQVSLNNNRSLGLSYIEKQPHGPGHYYSGLGAINNGNSLSSSPLVSSATNASGTLSSGFSYLASLGGDLDVTLTAFAGDSRAKVLQRPRVQTSHAVPATLFVGESRPYPVSSYYGGGAYGGYSSIQQLQIGVRIEVTPLINPDGLVVMDISTDIESFENNVTIQGVGDVPITSQKQASAKVAVRDHDTVMLGGLIQTDRSDSNSGVPILKDIPGLGYLFRSTSKSGSRSELIVLIRPTVLPTPEVAALAVRAEKDKMPEVKRAENEAAEDDANLLKKADRKYKQQ